jgi:hypothetical protein
MIQPASRMQRELNRIEHASGWCHTLPQVDFDILARAAARHKHGNMAGVLELDEATRRTTPGSMFNKTGILCGRHVEATWLGKKQSAYVVGGIFDSVDEMPRWAITAVVKAAQSTARQALPDWALAKLGKIPPPPRIPAVIQKRAVSGVASQAATERDRILEWAIATECAGLASENAFVGLEERIRLEAPKVDELHTQEQDLVRRLQRTYGREHRDLDDKLVAARHEYLVRHDALNALRSEALRVGEQAAREKAEAEQRVRNSFKATIHPGFELEWRAAPEN